MQLLRIVFSRTHIELLLESPNTVIDCYIKPSPHLLHNDYKHRRTVFVTRHNLHHTGLQPADKFREGGGKCL